MRTRKTNKKKYNNFRWIRRERGRVKRKKKNTEKRVHTFTGGHKRNLKKKRISPEARPTVRNVGHAASRYPRISLLLEKGCVYLVSGTLLRLSSHLSLSRVRHLCSVCILPHVRSFPRKGERGHHRLSEMSYNTEVRSLIERAAFLIMSTPLPGATGTTTRLSPFARPRFFVFSFSSVFFSPQFLSHSLPRSSRVGSECASPVPYFCSNDRRGGKGGNI